MAVRQFDGGYGRAGVFAWCFFCVRTVEASANRVVVLVVMNTQW